MDLDTGLGFGKIFGGSLAVIIAAAVVNLAILAGAVWVVVWVLRSAGVL